MDQDLVSKIIKEIENIRIFLSEDFAEIMESFLDNFVRSQKNTKVVNRKLSKLASIVSSLFLEISINNEQGKFKEEDINKMNELGKKLGDIQYKISLVVKDYDNIISSSDRIIENNIHLNDDISDLQDVAINIVKIFETSGFNVEESPLRYLVNDPEPDKQ